MSRDMTQYIIININYYNYTVARSFSSMSISLQLSPSTSAQRGEATVQPAYFTSSAFVDALRDDLQTLVKIYSEKYNEHLNTPRQVNDIKPFGLFKEVWSGLGWQWLHLKILEPRARESFLSTVLRLFIGK